MRLRINSRLVYYRKILLVALVTVSVSAFCLFFNSNEFGSRHPPSASLSSWWSQGNNEVDSVDNDRGVLAVLLENGLIACNFPKLNPFDDSIKVHLGDPGPANCDADDHPLIFKTDLNFTLIQVKDPQDYGYFNCCYTEFTNW